MKILVTGFNEDKKIMAIKGLRSVSRNVELKFVKEFLEGPLPALIDCRDDLTWEAISQSLTNHSVIALCADDNNAPMLQFLAALPKEMEIGQVRTVLSALKSFVLPVADGGRV